MFDRLFGRKQPPAGPATLASLVDDYSAQRATLAEVRSRGAALRDTPAFPDEVRALLEKVDRLRGERPDFELAAMQVCWAVCLDVQDGKLRGEIAFLLARSLMAARQWAEAEARLMESEHFFSIVREASKLTLIKATRASLALASGDTTEAIKLYRAVIAEFQAAEDDLNEAAASLGYGQALARTGQTGDARDAYRRALELSRGSGFRIDEFKALVLLSDSFMQASELAQGVDYLSQAASVARTANIPAHERIRTLGKLSSSAAKLGRFDKAIAACEEGVGLARAESDRQMEGFFEGNLGSVISQQGDPARALRHLERSLRIAHEVGDSEGVEIANHNIARAKHMASENPAPAPAPAAKPAIQSPSRAGAEATVEKLLSVARAWRNSGTRDHGLLERIGQPASPEDAEEIVKAVLDASDAVQSNDPYVAAFLVMATEHWLGTPAKPATMTRLYSSLGGFAMRGSDMAGARQCFEVAATIARDNNLTKEFVAASTNLGSVLRQSGATFEAAQVYEMALEAGAELEPRLRAMILVNASTAWADLGRRDRSIAMNGEAVQILRGEPDAADMLLIALINQSGGFFALNQLQEAETGLVEALDLARSTHNLAQEGVALGHLGLIRFSQGLPADAIRYLERAARQAEATKDLWNAQHWYRDLGNSYVWTGFLTGAEECYGRALELSRKVHDRRSEALSLLGIAMSTRDDTREQESLHSAWTIAKETGNVGVALEVAVHGVHSGVKRAVGADSASLVAGGLGSLEGGFKLRNRSAFDEAKRWLEHGRELLGQLGPGIFGEKFQTAEAEVLRLEGRISEAVEVLLDGLEDSRGLARSSREASIGLLYLKDLGRPDLALPYLENALAHREQTAGALRGDDHRLSMRDDSARIACWTIECALALGQTERAFAILERGKALRIRRLHKAGASMDDIHTPTLSDISRSVGTRQAAFISFALMVEKVYLFLVTPQKVHEPIEIKMGLEKLAALWLDIQAAYETARSPAAAFDVSLVLPWHRELQRACAELGNLLGQELAPLLEQTRIREVVLVPQSMLHCFPLHAVLLPDGKALTDNYVVSYVPSAQEFIAGCNEPREIDGSGEFVAFTDSLSDLPLARFEAAAPPLWASSQAAFSGPQVTRKNVFSMFAGAEWLHIGCHARQMLGNDDLTGVYLADVADDEADRMLSLRSIARNARMRKGAIVVLSGCETSSVTPRMADEYISLAGAFIAAGASAVVASLWKVRDSAALLLMHRFYSEIEILGDLPRALQSAQIWLRELSADDAYRILVQIVPESPNREALLVDFAARDRHCPFAAVADWGAFQIVGAGNRRYPAARISGVSS